MTFQSPLPSVSVKRREEKRREEKCLLVHTVNTEAFHTSNILSHFFTSFSQCEKCYVNSGTNKLKWKSELLFLHDNSDTLKH